MGDIDLVRVISAMFNTHTCHYNDVLINCERERLSKSRYQPRRGGGGGGSGIVVF